MESGSRQSAPIWERFGDQRAKDLIDRSYAETDPRRAIRRLHRALRYGRTSIQAMKAYQNLGMRYEDLGNAPRAIFYYTETIELGDALSIPPVPALYWRGVLYYQRGDWEAARRDFERAVALDEPRTWFPEERATAERLLVDFRDYGPQALDYGSREGVESRTAAVRKRMLALQEELGRFEVQLRRRYGPEARPIPELLADIDELREALGNLRAEMNLYYRQSLGQLPIRLCFAEKS